MELFDLVTDMLGEEIGLGIEPVSDGNGLKPIEAASVARAVPKRINEFAAGRRAARRALAALGIPDATLPVGSDRAPIWPEGFAGSITHDNAFALAAVGHRDRTRAIGIDMTEAAPLPGETRCQILRHPDEAGLDEMSARAVFSAKETIFKALSADVGFVFGFSAVVVNPDFDAGRFKARLSHPLGPYGAGQVWEGALAMSADRIVTSMVLPSEAVATV